MPSPLTRRRLGAVALVLAVLAGCGGDGDGDGDGDGEGDEGADGSDGGGTQGTSATESAPTSTATSAPDSSADDGGPGRGDEAGGAADPPGRYLSLGDSYASGFDAAAGANTESGFAYRVPELAAAAGRDLELTNLGCGGATTASFTSGPPCAGAALGPGAPAYDSSQLEAAEAFLREHEGEVELVTLSIGGNDVTACAAAPDPIGCVTGAVAGIEATLGDALPRLRDAAGPDVAVVGLTYPDVILGQLLSPDPAAQELARLSVVAFRELVNPALQRAYEAVGATFVDVTAASGAYGDLAELTTLDPYGEIPVPVADVCRLTFICEAGDIHPTAAGYQLIAELVAAALPALD